MAEPFELVQRGEELVEQGKYTEAETKITRGIREYQKRKDVSGVHFGMGRLGYCYERAGRPDQAIQTYAQSIADGSNIPATFAGLIPLLIYSKQWDRAFEAAETWSKRSSFGKPAEAQDIFITIASNLIRRGEAAQAFDLLTRTLAGYNPKKHLQYWQIRGLLGQAREKSGEIEAAMMIYADAIHAGSKDKATFNRYLILLEKAKQYDLELQIIDKALQVQKDAEWEADLKKRQQRVLEKTGAVPKGAAAAGNIPDFAIRKGERNVSLIRQTKFSPQLLHLVFQDGVFYGMTGGKRACVFAYRLDSDERLWEVPIEGDPDGLLVSGQRLVMYSRNGTVANGQTNLYFLDINGNSIASDTLPGVPSQVAAVGGRVFVGCRDGKLYAFSDNGKRLWAYAVPGSKDGEGSLRPCPYYVAVSQERVAFSSFESLYVLSHDGKIINKWAVPDRVSSTKNEMFTISTTLSGGSITALALSSNGDRAWVGANDVLYALEKGKVSAHLSVGKYARINHIAWVDGNSVAMTTHDQFLLMRDGKIASRFGMEGGGFVRVSQAANRIVVWCGSNMVVATASGTPLVEIEFAKAVHQAVILDDSRVLVGTRYAILLDTDTTRQKEMLTDGKPAAKAATKTVERPDVEQGFPVMWRTARKLSIGSGKAVYLGTGGKELTIEQAVLEQLAAEGYAGGVWTENNAWWEIMALLFWDVLFAPLSGIYSPELGAFPGPHQDMPRDLFQPSFYQRRRDIIEKRIKQFTQSGLFGLAKPLTPADELRKSYQNHRGQPCRPIENWEQFSPDALVSMVSRISTPQLMGIMLRLLENFNDNRSGLPDLFLSDPTGKPAFVEVKSENEKWADHQVAWARFLRDNLGISVSVCRVMSSS